MSRYCLDTSAYINFKRGDLRVVELVDQAEWIGVPAVVSGELRVGFLLGSHRQRNETEFQEFLAHPVVEDVPLDGEASRHYAQIVVDLRRSGTPVPTNDIWVAAAAARTGSMVLTYDAHFRAIATVGARILE